MSEGLPRGIRSALKKAAPKNPIGLHGRRVRATAWSRMT
jgi:hypothetical protein